MELKRLKEFLNIQKDILVEIIGYSVLGQEIYAIKKEYNKNNRWALITAGMHAREHLATDLICLFLEDLKLIESLPFNIAFVPLVNPDGVELCENGTKNIDSESAKRLIEINGSKDFSLYKANARGVDLNNNWDANWEIHFTNKTKPSSQGYYGEKPMSEPEVIALANFTAKLNPFITVNYHLKGEEIYFDFFQNEEDYERDELIAKIFSQSSGYKIVKTQVVSSGGFKDWCVQKLHIPALTIELGSDKFSHPYPKQELYNIYLKNKNIFNCLENSLKIIKNN